MKDFIETLSSLSGIISVFFVIDTILNAEERNRIAGLFQTYINGASFFGRRAIGPTRIVGKALAVAFPRGYKGALRYFFAHICCVAVSLLTLAATSEYGREQFKLLWVDHDLFEVDRLLAQLCALGIAALLVPLLIPILAHSRGKLSILLFAFCAQMTVLLSGLITRSIDDFADFLRVGSGNLNIPLSVTIDTTHDPTSSAEVLIDRQISDDEKKRLEAIKIVRHSTDRAKNWRAERYSAEASLYTSDIVDRVDNYTTLYASLKATVPNADICGKTISQIVGKALAVKSKLIKIEGEQTVNCAESFPITKKSMLSFSPKSQRGVLSFGLGFRSGLDTTYLRTIQEKSIQDGITVIGDFSFTRTLKAPEDAETSANDDANNEISGIKRLFDARSFEPSLFLATTPSMFFPDISFASAWLPIVTLTIFAIICCVRPIGILVARINTITISSRLKQAPFTIMGVIFLASATLFLFLRTLVQIVVGP